jgi:hypothetical protein
MRFVFALCLFILTAPGLAQAQNDPLSYTTLGARKERTGGHMNHKVLKYEDAELQYKADLKNQPGEKTPDVPPDEAAADAVWEKYKALAAGTYKEPEEPKEPVKPAKEEVEDKPQTGLAGIIEQYNKNKTERSQMRTISVTKPEDIKKKEPEAPVNEAKGKEDEEPEQKPRD